jgi:hypothetical protein
MVKPKVARGIQRCMQSLGCPPHNPKDTESTCSTVLSPVGPQLTVSQSALKNMLDAHAHTSHVVLSFQVTEP